MLSAASRGQGHLKQRRQHAAEEGAAHYSTARKIQFDSEVPEEPEERRP
jgi:hypothetical protein